MGGGKPLWWLAAALGAAGGLFLTAAPAGLAAAETWRARVSMNVQSVYDAHAPDTAQFDPAGRVQADIHYDCAAGSLAGALASAGLETNSTYRLPPVCVVEGWLSPASIPKVADVAGVTQVRLPSYARHIPRPTVRSSM